MAKPKEDNVRRMRTTWFDRVEPRVWFVRHPARSLGAERAEQRSHGDG